MMDQPREKITGPEPENVRKLTLQVLAGFSRDKSSLIPVLQAIQEKLGYLPRPALLETAACLGLAPVEVYGVATFYNRFRLNPPGKHSIKVCLGTACHMKGGHISLEAWQRRLEIKVKETTPDREFDLDTVTCVGCCHMAPVSVVDGQAAGGVEPTKVDGILLGFGRTYESKDKDKK